MTLLTKQIKSIIRKIEKAETKEEKEEISKELLRLANTYTSLDFLKEMLGKPVESYFRISK